MEDPNWRDFKPPLLDLVEEDNLKILAGSEDKELALPKNGATETARERPNLVVFSQTASLKSPISTNSMDRNGYFLWIEKQHLQDFDKSSIE